MRHTLLIRHVCPNICTDITNAQPYTVATHTPASLPLPPSLLATALQSCCDRKHAVYPKDTFAAHQISVLTNWPEYLPNTFGMPRELTHKVGLTHTRTHTGHTCRGRGKRRGLPSRAAPAIYVSQRKRSSAKRQTNTNPI